MAPPMNTYDTNGRAVAMTTTTQPGATPGATSTPGAVTTNYNNDMYRNKEAISLAEDKPSHDYNYNSTPDSPIAIDRNWWQSIYFSTDTGSSAINGENDSTYAGDEPAPQYQSAPVAPSAPQEAFNNYPSSRSVYAPSIHEGPPRDGLNINNGAVPQPSQELIALARQASVEEGGKNGYKTGKKDIQFLERDDWELLASRSKDGKIKGIPVLFNRVENKHYFPHYDDRTRQVAQRFGVPLPPKRS